MTDIDEGLSSPAYPGALAAPDQPDDTGHVRAMARGSFLNLLGSLCTQSVLFFVTLLIARKLGRTQVGLYAEAYAFFVLCGLFALSGLRAGVTRYVAVHRVEGDSAALRGVIRLALGATTVVSGAMAVALFASAPTLAHAVFHQSALVMPLRYVALAVPLATFSDTALSATQGYRTMKPYALIELIAEPVCRIALTAGLIAQGFGLRGAMLAMVLSNAIAALLGGLVLRRMIGRHTERPRYNTRELFSFSTVNWVATLASAGLIYADTLILGILRSSSQVGTYNVATRLVTTASFVMLPINMSFAPWIADLHRRGDTKRLRVAYHAATSWIVRLSMPAFIALVCFPRSLLHFFGRSFSDAAAVTVIFAVGKLVDAGTGPCGLMLNMIGRPRFQMVNNLAVLALNVILNLWWIPRYGIVGSAAAWTTSLVVVNATRMLQVRSILGMFPFDRSVLKGALAGAVALVIGSLISVVRPPHEFLVGLASVGITYIALLGVQRLTDQDREVLNALRPRSTNRAVRP